MDIKTELKNLCTSKNITFKELAERAGMNTNGLHDKCRRNSMTVKDFEKLLDIFEKELAIIDKKKQSFYLKQQKQRSY